MDITMQTCKYCGNETPAGSVFCMICGERLARKKRDPKAGPRVPKPRQLPSGTWFAQMMLDGERVPISAATEAEYYNRAEAIKLGIAEAKKKPKAVTLSAAIDRYIAARDLSPPPPPFFENPAGVEAAGFSLIFALLSSLSRFSCHFNSELQGSILSLWIQE